jgi:hypothetical protein
MSDKSKPGCPECGSADFNIHCRAYLTVCATVDAAPKRPGLASVYWHDHKNLDPGWSPTSLADCDECEFEGTVADFTKEN